MMLVLNDREILGSVETLSKLLQLCRKRPSDSHAVILLMFTRYLENMQRRSMSNYSCSSYPKHDGSQAAHVDR